MLSLVILGLTVSISFLAVRDAVVRCLNNVEVGE
jgi:hypothetical protein